MPQLELSTYLRKMRHSGEATLSYYLADVEISKYLGQQIKLEFSGEIQCVNCARKTKKTFGDGYCYPCSQKLAACDICILKPELCHFRFGTCREPDWGKEHCLIPHVVYLSNTTGLKVGITREHKKFERWGDQGAISAIVIARVPERYLSGLLEDHLRAHVNDRTDWRALICGKDREVDLLKERERLASLFPEEYKQYLVEASEIYNFKYPILKYPAKAVSHNFDKDPLAEGVVNGIRGQYLFVGERAVNIRKFSGYKLALTLE